MATSVKQLIEQLQAIEDQDQPILFQYYLREDFEYGDDETTVSDEAFLNAIDRVERTDGWEDARSYINDVVYEESYKLSTDEDEDADADED